MIFICVTVSNHEANAELGQRKTHQKTGEVTQCRYAVLLLLLCYTSLHSIKMEKGSQAYIQGIALIYSSMKMCVPTGMDIRGCHCVYTYAYVTSALKYINIVTGNSNSRRIAYIYSMYTERNYFV